MVQSHDTCSVSLTREVIGVEASTFDTARHNYSSAFVSQPNARHDRRWWSLAWTKSRPIGFVSDGRFAGRAPRGTRINWMANDHDIEQTCGCDRQAQSGGRSERRPGAGQLYAHPIRINRGQAGSRENPGAYPRENNPVSNSVVTVAVALRSALATAFSNAPDRRLRESIEKLNEISMSNSDRDQPPMAKALDTLLDR